MKRIFARDAARAEALFQSEKTEEAEQICGRLNAVWDRSFLNYTPESPGHWRDPEHEYTENMEDPAQAVPYLNMLLAAPGGTERFRDRVQAYCEFFAAVWRTNFMRSDLKPMAALLKRSAGSWPETPGFKA